MRNDIVKFIKKQWLLVWIVVVALLLTTLVARAAYETTTSSMEKVVVSTSSQGLLFSSNILVKDGGSTYVPKAFSPREASQYYDVDVYLWNYDMNNPSKWYSSDIDYKVTVELTDSNGNAISAATMGQRSIILTDKNGDTLATLDGTTPTLSWTSSTQTLDYDTDEGTEGKYTLKFSGNWNLDEDIDICVKMTAALFKGDDASKYMDLADLSAVVGLKKLTTVDAKGWQAYVSEKEENVDVNDCDGYNLVVSGSGEATITIKWDTTKLQCNRNFYNNTINSFGTGEVTGPTTNGNIATLVINANTASATTNNRNRYDIQFYKTGSDEPSSWDFVTDDGTTPSGTIWLTTKVEQ
ncbi:hypothetical protein SAMN04487934_10535 [Eubacterium ruminantium]|nr:hypothetical protein SAMN04487934_10535 [Eubacterium ruminantium]